MNRGEIWWTDFDPAIGSEIQKTRPAVIVSSNRSNSRLARVVVIPFSTQVARLYPAEAIVTVGSKPAKALVDQITVADKSRLRNRIGKLSISDMHAIEDVIRLHLAL